MAKKIKIKLSPEVADKYEVTNNPVSNKFINHPFGEINLRELTLKQANALVKNGFKYLKPKKAAKDK